MFINVGKKYNLNIFRIISEIFQEVENKTFERRDFSMSDIGKSLV